MMQLLKSGTFIWAISGGHELLFWQKVGCWLGVYVHIVDCTWKMVVQ